MLITKTILLAATMIPISFTGADRGKRLSAPMPEAPRGPRRTRNKVTASPRRASPLADTVAPTVAVADAAVETRTCSDRRARARNTSKKTKNLRDQSLHRAIEPVSRDVAIRDFFEIMMAEAHGGSLRFDHIARNYQQMIDTDAKPWPPLKAKALSQGLRKLGCKSKVANSKDKFGKRPTVFTFPKRRARKEAA